MKYIDNETLHNPQCPYVYLFVLMKIQRNKIMKTIIRYFALITLFTFMASCNSSGNSRVYICTGPYSKAYHKTSDCKGLNNCSGNIKEITKSEAIDEGRHKCGFCY